MTFRFWGTRGSVPTPLSPAAVRAKISSVLQRVKAIDVASVEAKERFLAGLPEELFGHVGGNTTCLEVVSQQQTDVVFVDAGTGLVEAGRFYETNSKGPVHYHIFLTHFHWDHIQGLPFFPGLNRSENTITLYSPVGGFERFIHEQMRAPFFPVPLSIFPARVEFSELKGSRVTLGSLIVTWKTVQHPGSCVSYRFDADDRALVFSTDTELRAADFVKTGENNKFYEAVDVLVMDAQYTLGEAIEKADWGHSSASLAVDFAVEFHVRCLYLFHHEPSNSDAKIEEIGRLAQWYADHKKAGHLEVKLAREGRSQVIT
ncbi:MAG: MBL fold metallo-hydrolase [Spirochaetales bacterium]